MVLILSLEALLKKTCDLVCKRILMFSCNHLHITPNHTAVRVFYLSQLSSVIVEVKLGKPACTIELVSCPDCFFLFAWGRSPHTKRKKRRSGHETTIELCVHTHALVSPLDDFYR